MKKSIIIFLNICLLVQTVSAESFRAYTPEDGLSHCTVLHSAQDRNGLMWFGTEDGLNSFDGYHFKIYRHITGDQSTIPGDRVSAIAVCSDGSVWVSVGAKIARFNRSSGTFTSFDNPGLGRQVRNLFEIEPGKMAVSYEGQLWCFDTDSETFQTTSIPTDLVNSSIISYYCTDEAIALGASNGDIYIWNKTDGSVRRINSISGDIRIRCLLLSDGELWIGTEGSGLYCYSLSGESIRCYTAASDKLCSDYIRAISKDKYGRLWIGTYQGLDILSDDTIRHFSHKAGKNGSLSDNSIRTITKDSQGGMWLGSFYGGVNYWHSEGNQFKPIEEINDSFPLDGSMQAIAESRSGDIWIGIDYQTVARYTPSSGKVRKYSVHGVGGAPMNIKTIHFDGDNLYLGSQLGGLVVLNSRTGEYHHINSKDIPANVTCILEKDKDNILLGTTEGIFLFNKRKNKAERIPSSFSNNTITSIIRDQSGRIWVGGNSGIAIYEEEGGSLHSTTLDGNLIRIRKVKRLFQSSDGSVFICADKFSRFSPTEGSIESYSVEDGLPTNRISDIIEDKEGRLWLFSSNGLCCFDPQRKTIKQYRDNDGFIFSNFGSASICKAESGVVYIGTRDGIMCFLPDQIENNPFSPTPVISCISQSGKTLDGEIVLPYNKNTLSFEFNTYNYISGGNDEFAFRLTGYDKEWRTQRGNNTVTYYNIPPGKYTFEVKAANNDGIWCSGVSSRAVQIRQFFAISPLAITIYIILALVLIGALVYIRFQHLEKQHLEEVHNLKVRFFINFLNELKTPLTLINSPLQEMIPRAESGWMRSQLRYVEKSSRRLIHLVGQMMLFRKAQLDVISLHAVSFDADSLIKDITNAFGRYIKQRGLDFEYKSSLEGRAVLADPQYLELILSNLLSNAAKFTKEGSISVSADIVGDFLRIEVKDSGDGIQEDKLSHIFDRFYHSGSEHIGSGLGLAIVKQLLESHHGRLDVSSKEGYGSAFTFYIPQKEDAYSSKELYANSGYSYEGFEEDSLEDYTDAPPLENIGSGLANRGRLLLVIADNKMMSYLNEGLSRNFDVLMCASEAEAMSLCLSHEIDAVIIGSDGSIDGLRLCKKIKADVGSNHIHVVILASSYNSSDQLNAFVAGASDVIAQPFSLAVLTVKIGNMIADRKKKSDNKEEERNEANVQVYGTSDERFLEKVNTAIENRIDDTDLSINDIVKEIGMSRSSFFLKIKSITGLSPQDYMRNIRFRIACKLLLESDKSIAEIASLTGFNTASYFTRAFKSYYGILPSNYRLKHEK